MLISSLLEMDWSNGVIPSDDARTPVDRSINGPGESRIVPVWNPALRELQLSRRFVKRFARPAPILEAILARFQELSWPARIDDPLPPQAGIDPRQRLHDAIKRLNRCQKPQFIRFSGDGTAKGIRWELVESLEDSHHQSPDEPHMSPT